jgi:hypothetical protein
VSLVLNFSEGSPPERVANSLAWPTCFRPLGSCPLKSVREADDYIKAEN